MTDLDRRERNARKRERRERRERRRNGSSKPRASFADEFLFRRFNGAGSDAIQRLAMFNWWEWRRQMSAYLVGLEGIGDLDHPGDRANDYSPEPDE